MPPIPVILRFCFGLAMASSIVGPAAAQNSATGGGDWPNKTVRVIVNFGPGGSADNSMRPYSERLTKKLGQQFVLEYRGGASGAIGAEAVAKSPPDGYTFLITPSLSMVILPHLRKLPFEPLKDLVSVSQITDSKLLFAVHPSVPVNNMKEFVDYAKKNPGKLSWGTAGVGSTGHILYEMFKVEAGIDMLHVPYRGGGESLADFLAGVVQVHADPNTLPHVSAGKAKLFAVLDRARLPDFPNVPIMTELYPGIDFLSWFGVYAPAGTPEPIIKKFAEELNKIATEPEMMTLMQKSALAPYPGKPEELGALTRKDFDRFGAIIKKLGIKAE